MPISVEDAKNAGDLWQPTKREGLFQCSDLKRFIQEQPEVNKLIQEKDGKVIPEQIINHGEWTYKVKVDDKGNVGLIRWKAKGGAGKSYPQLEFNTKQVMEFDNVIKVNDFLESMDKSDGVVTAIREVFPQGDKRIYIVEVKKPIYIPKFPGQSLTAAASSEGKKEDAQKAAA